MYSIKHSKEMILYEIDNLFPFKKLIKLLFGMAVCIQLIVISYNHWSGFHVMEDTTEFVLKLIWGVILSMTGGFLLAYPDLLIIRYLNKHFNWSNEVFKRVFIQLFFAILLAIGVSIAITLLSNLLRNYEEELSLVLIYNAMIFSVCNVILMITLEALIFFMDSSEAKKITKNLEKELSQIRFEVLKNQINPHFMFNSLNVLSGLINKNTEKAQRFIDEFSHIYRYVLDSIEKPVVTLNEELTFARSYMFLQQIRYGKDLDFSINVPAHLLHMYLPPLSLQLVLENAIKHNQISAEIPLRININFKKNNLVVSNNVHLKIFSGKRNQLGQKNLVKRYKLISEKTPKFEMHENQFLVTLPLISEEDEYIDY